jgi:hypothetical protein
MARFNDGNPITATGTTPDDDIIPVSGPVDLNVSGTLGGSTVQFEMRYFGETVWDPISDGLFDAVGQILFTPPSDCHVRYNITGGTPNVVLGVM